MAQENRRPGCIICGAICEGDKCAACSGRHALMASLFLDPSELEDEPRQSAPEHERLANDTGDKAMSEQKEQKSKLKTIITIREDAQLDGGVAPKTMAETEAEKWRMAGYSARQYLRQISVDGERVSVFCVVVRL